MKILLIALLIIIIVGGIWLGKDNLIKKTPMISSTQVIQAFATPAPSESPFKDLTVPYLRSREYKSTLGELTENYETSSYTAYLTDYNSDGFKVNGLLTIPKGEEPMGGWPAIIFVHGYIPPNSYQTTRQYYDYVDYLAENGFVVFKIDLRGHGDSEGEAGGGYYGSDYIVDTLNAYSALQSSDFVDPNGIGLWGHSMAGNVTLRSMAAKPEIPAASIWAGAVFTYLDQRKYGISDSSFQPNQRSAQSRSRRAELFAKEGSPSAESKFWQQVIPTNYLNDLKGAIQLNHAVNDDVVNIGYSRDLNALLDKTSVPHELHEYQSGGHNLSGGEFDEAMQNTVDFFKKYLK